MTFQEQMETLFGSDEAIGIRFQVEGEGECPAYKVGDILSYQEWLDIHTNDPERALGIDFMSLMPDGSSATCCTNYARHIQRTLGEDRVAIHGFANEDNPTARIAKEKWHPGGHDFAVVDGRYIVDPWPRLVACTTEKMVWDLHDPEDGREALDLYGPPNKWEQFFEFDRNC